MANIDGLWGGGGKGMLPPLSDVFFFFGGGGAGAAPPPLSMLPPLLPTPMDIVDDGKQLRNQIIPYARSHFQQW